MEAVSRWYRIGGFVISLKMPPMDESVYLRPFRCEEQVADWSFCVHLGKPMLPEQITYLQRGLHSGNFLDGEASCRVLFREKSDRPLLISREISPGRFEVCLEEECLNLWDGNLLLKLLDIPQLFLERGAIFLHASFVAYQGKAVLFTAPKQTGKSTQAALWQEYAHGEIINGDRALLRRMGETWYACGSPYCGTSQICNTGEYPVAALVILSQGLKNELRKALPREMVAAMLDGCTYDPQSQTEQIVDVALDIFGRFPVYHFSCLADESAVTCLRNAIFPE